MAKCSICNRRWFFSSKVKCTCRADQLKNRAVTSPAQRSIQHTNYNNDTDIALLAMHQQNINQIQQQHSDISEGCRTGIPSSEYRFFDSSPSHCNSSHDSSSSSSSESSSSYDSGSSSSSSLD